MQHITVGQDEKCLHAMKDNTPFTKIIIGYLQSKNIFKRMCCVSYLLEHQQVNTSEGI